MKIKKNKKEKKILRWFKVEKHRSRGEVICNYLIMFSIVTFFATMWLTEYIDKSSGSFYKYSIYILTILSFFILFISLTLKMTYRFRRRYTRRVREEK